MYPRLTSPLRPAGTACSSTWLPEPSARTSLADAAESGAAVHGSPWSVGTSRRSGGARQVHVPPFAVNCANAVHGAAVSVHRRPDPRPWDRPHRLDSPTPSCPKPTAAPGTSGSGHMYPHLPSKVRGWVRLTRCVDPLPERADELMYPGLPSPQSLTSTEGTTITRAKNRLWQPAQTIGPPPDDGKPGYVYEQSKRQPGVPVTSSGGT